MHTPSEPSATKFAVEINSLDAIGSAIRELIPFPPWLRVVIITDQRVGAFYGGRVCQSLADADLRPALYSVRPGEASKSLGTVAAIYQFLNEHRVGRDALILALGGGVVSDLAGFVAATWMRGVRLVICPTTLQADVDACLGGKTAINVPGAKNLVGTFHQPVLVAIDPACLKTLESRDVCSGMAESVKHALISSEDFLAWHETNALQILDLDDSILVELIERNLLSKRAIVEQDPFERTGRRMHLNFGHTIGHAIEECSGFTLRHGECIALGILAACRLSNNISSLPSVVVDRVANLLGQCGLPTQLPEPLQAERILRAIRRDKKTRGDKLQFVVLQQIGRPSVREDVPDKLVRQAYESLLP